MFGSARRCFGLCSAAILALGLVVRTAAAQAPSDALALPTYGLLDPAPDPMARPLAGVAPFVFPGTDTARARALHCLTQAVYYEAATEPREGQEAVAQVVLNRMKHPAFPKSVCGVVFEGAERTTGCQFTFTCDGSLDRAPISWRWDAAEQVAEAALDGHVASAVGAATHYHAARMTPYWSASLSEVSRIGGHIFYRMPGANGSPEALIGQYAGAEPAAPTGLAAKVKVVRAIGSKSRRRPAPPAAPGVAEFSVWGLQVATVTAHRGEVVVKTGS